MNEMKMKNKKYPLWKAEEVLNTPLLPSYTRNGT